MNDSPGRSREPLTAAPLALVLATLALPLAGCKSVSGPGTLGTPSRAADVFGPVALRIHPLTHLEPRTDGTCDVVLHFELKDRYGDTVKGLGSLTVLLYRPERAGDAMETQELRWTIADFVSPDSNSRRFDRATRSYRVQLQAADWVAKLVNDRPGGYVKLRVVLTTAPDTNAGTNAGTDAAGTAPDPITLSDDFVVQR